MALQSSPRIGAFFVVSETGAAGAGSAGAPTDQVNLSSAGASGNVATGTTLTVGTGTATSANVQVSTQLSLAGATQSVNLNSFVGTLGTKVLAKVRGIFIRNNAAAESGFALIVLPDSSSGWTNGPFAAAGITIPANSTFYLENINIAGWTVTSGNKNLQFNPGANTFTCSVGLIGE